jgi:glutamate formiminotransferase
VEGQAQVSINLVDFRRTPLQHLFTEIVRLAGAHGTTVTHSELIGLLPQEALLAVAVDALKLTNLSADKVLEQALAQAQWQETQRRLTH